LGGIEKYNSKMEGYEAITCLELIEHLDPNVLSRFGVVTMGTYRPRLMLITTPVSPHTSTIVLASCSRQCRQVGRGGERSEPTRELTGAKQR